MGRYNNAARHQRHLLRRQSGATHGRTSLRRNWNDIDGNRIVDCDLMNFTPNGECGDVLTARLGTDTTRRRYGKDPLGLDAAGNPIGLDTVQCGRTEQGISGRSRPTATSTATSLVNGWGKRAENGSSASASSTKSCRGSRVRSPTTAALYRNLTSTDQLGIGCDRFNGAHGP